MSSKEILDQAMALKPKERFMIVEGLLKSLDEPDRKLDEIWAEEAEKRLKAYREGRLEGSYGKRYALNLNCNSNLYRPRCRDFFRGLRRVSGVSFPVSS